MLPFEELGTLARLLRPRTLALSKELSARQSTRRLLARVAELDPLGVDGRTALCLRILNIISTQPTDAVALSHVLSKRTDAPSQEALPRP